MADCDDTKLQKIASSQLLLVLHRLVGIIGVPVIIGFVGWFAMTFDDMRFTVKSLQKDFVVIERNLKLLNLKVFGFDLLGEKVEDAKPN